MQVLLRNLKPGHLDNKGLSMCELTVKYTEGRGSSPAGIPEVCGSVTGSTQYDMPSSVVVLSAGLQTAKVPAHWEICKSLEPS